MAFEIIDIIETASVATGVSAGLAKMRNAPALLRFSIRPGVFAEMGFADGDRFVVMLGTGEDFGIVRLQKNKAGNVKAKRRETGHGGHYFSISLRHRPEFVDRIEKARECQWEKVDLTTIEIVLPAWADETNPEKRKRIAGVPSSVMAGQREADRLRREREDADKRRGEMEAREEEREKRRLVDELMNSSAPEFRTSLALTRSQKEMLTVLIAKAGRTVSRETLMQLLYDEKDSVEGDKVIDVQFSYLRKKLPPAVNIENVRGVGWKITGDTAALYEPEEA